MNSFHHKSSKFRNISEFAQSTSSHASTFKSSASKHDIKLFSKFHFEDVHHNDNSNKRDHVTKHSLEIKFIVLMSNIIFFPKSSTYVPTTADSEKWLLPTKGLPYFFGRNDSFQSSQSLFWSPSLKMACFLSKSLYASMKNDYHMNMRGSLTHSFEMKEYIFDFVSVFFFL